MPEGKPDIPADLTRPGGVISLLKVAACPGWTCMFGSDVTRENGLKEAPAWLMRAGNLYSPISV